VIPLDELGRPPPGKIGSGWRLNIQASPSARGRDRMVAGRVADLGVQYLMIVPNDADRFLLDMEQDRSRRDYAPVLKSLGWEVVAREPMFDDENGRRFLGCTT